MPVEIVKKVDCTGCAACANICPKKCISMRRDASGFLYPVINTDNCIRCELCTKVCPIVEPLKETERINKTEVYAGWTNDTEVRYNSTSGGVFSELAKIVISQKGMVSGAVYNQDCEVEHALVSDEEGLCRVRQSKYVQSEIKAHYQEIKELLAQKKQVLFCGTPCQVAGLKKYLGKQYDNLVTVDFICRGVNSPKAYRCWLDELEGKYNSKAVKVWFKYKINGWKKSPQCTRIDFANGESCVQNSVKNTYMRGYLGPNLYIRPSCGDCRFKGGYQVSDITLADFWGISKHLDDDKGTSLILIHTEKGKRLFGQCRQKIFCEHREMNEITRGNVCFEQSVTINPRSEEFLQELDHEPFSVLIEKYARVSLYARIKGKIKGSLRRGLR